MLAVEDVVGVAAEEVDVVAGHGVDECDHIRFAGRIGAVEVVVVPGGAVGGRYRGVGSDEDGGRFVHVGEVLGQPGHLLGRVVALVVAPGVGTRAHAVVVDVVHHYEMDLAQIERVVGRGYIAGVAEGLVVVAHGVHVVVVVAHRVEERGAEHCVHGLEILGELVAVAVPVEVPGHVAEGHYVARLA